MQLYLTSTTLLALSASRADSIILTNSRTRSTPTRTALMISCAANGVPPAFDSTHNSRCGFNVSVSEPEDTTVSMCVGSMIGCRLRVSAGRRLQHTLRNMQKRCTGGCDVSPATSVRALQASADISMVRQHWTTRTMITSSPITSTSGLQKWRSAVIAARDAQSSKFPESDKKCNVSRNCQTCV